MIFNIILIAAIIGIAYAGYVNRARIIPFLSTLNRDSLIRIALWTFFSLVVIVGLRSCAGSGDNGTSIGSGLWVLLGGGLIVAAVMTKGNGRLPYVFSGGAAIVVLVLLGKIDGLFSWAVIGLPLFAAAGIWGMTKAEGRMKSFLGFASGIVILFWMFLFYKGHSIEDLGFIGRTFFPDDIAKSVFVIFLAIFLFAIWKRSKVFYLISFVVLLSFLGKATINQVVDRLPVPKISLGKNEVVKKISGAAEKMADALATRADAKVGREAVSARQAQQIQKTWMLLSGKLVYENPGNGIFVPKADLKYNKDVEVISLGEAVEINGATYEKCGLPDPTTGQPGASVGWIFSGDLKDKDKEVVPVKTSQDKDVRKQELVTGLFIDGSEFFTQLKDQLGEGKYRFDVEPASAAADLKIRIRDASSGLIREDRSLDGNYIFIGNGEKGTAIGTEVPIVLNITKV